jgi:hypothetical protein
MGLDQRSCIVQPRLKANGRQKEPWVEAKPFDIATREVWEVFKKVRANQGMAGVDGQSIQDFEADLSNNFYKIWNRLSSGSCFRPPVQRVLIPKPGGDGDCVLGGAPWRIAAPGKWSGAIWSPSWIRFSMRTPVDIALAAQRSMRSGRLVSGVGEWLAHSVESVLALCLR